MKTREEIPSMLDMSNYPERVPALPKRGTPTKIFVKIFFKRPKAVSAWYKNGEIYRVFNKVYWGFYTGGAHLVSSFNKKGYPEYGIALEDCEILNPGDYIKVKPVTPEYTLEDLEKKVGHKFTLKINT